MANSFVLKGDICYSVGPKTLRCLPNGHLVCLGGVSAGAFECLPERYADLPSVDCAGDLILPGLCDLHTHAPQYPFRALGMDLELLEWLDTRAFPEEAKYADTGYAREAYSILIQDLIGGPNTRLCIFATMHVPATVLLMEMLEESGLACLVGKVNMDRNSPPDLCETGAEQSVADTRRWLEAVRGLGNVLPILTPRFIPACSDALLRELGALQRETGLPVQSHLSENPREIAWVAELCPDSSGYGDAYRRFGLFGGGMTPAVMAHCVWSGDKEIDLMRRQGVFAAHCPQSNANLSSGIMPARRFLERGVPMGLGSDVAGGCQYSIFRAMADAIQASKLHWRLCDADEPPLTLEEAFWLGTAGGGAFFGRVGSFEAGYEFDALVVGDSAIGGTSAPAIPDRLARVVYLSDDRHIKRKYVRGRIVK